MTKTNIRKRAISILLILMVMLTMTPMTASAAEWTTVNSFEELHTAVNNKTKNIKLGQNIDTSSLHDGLAMNTSDLLDFENQDFVLDLNGKTLHLEMKIANPCFIQVVDGSLTIKDSSLAKTGAITGLFGAVKGGWIDHLIFVGRNGSLTLEGGTFSVKGIPFSDVLNAVCCINASVTIKDGVKLIQPEYSGHVNNHIGDLEGQGYALYTEGNNKVIIDGGEFDGYVNLSGYQGTNGSVQINGGTFKKGVQVRYTAEENNSDPAVVVNDGIFEGDVYLQYWPWKTSLYMPYRLNGGTFKGTVDLNADGKVNAEDNPNIAMGLDKCFGYSAVVTPDGTFTGPNVYTAVLKKIAKSEGYKMLLEGSASNPIRIIPNAWGMKSVTLDGNPIDYFKDWKGTVERMDNSTAHTLKFEWYPLAQELKDAGYSYRTKCEHYISGSSAVQHTDTIAADKTSHTVTIEKGADPKVYSFALHLNLKKGDSNIGIYSNEHIVKLVVNEAPVAPPTLSGKVYYTSGIVYGHSISTAASVTPAEATKSCQWQRSADGGSTWTNIDGATRGSYTPVAADMGENVRIRVKITAEGYLGEIIGLAVKVSKDANNKLPNRPEVEAQKDTDGKYTEFKINNFNFDEQEYVYTTSAPTSGNEWPTSGTEINSTPVTGLTEGNTYYIFTRYKGTATHTAGSLVSRDSVRLYDYGPLQHVLLEGYDSGNTIYIEKGKSVTLKVSADPINANSWSEITFKDSSVSSLGASNITISNEKIDASGTTATAFPNDHSITITGVSTGSATLSASYSGPMQPYYGQWSVVVYDDSTVTNALRLENVYTYADITLSENDEAKLPTELPTLLPENSGYQLEWRIVKAHGTGFEHLTQDDNITLENGKIKPKTDLAASGKSRLELVAVKEGETKVKPLSPSSGFYVTVTKAPTIALTGITVAPKKVNLANVGATCQLAAVKQPVNAAGNLTWTSDKPAVAVVDITTGMVTAKAQGTAKITATCDGKSATCTVTVGHTHDTDAQPCVYMDPGTHIKTCTAGDDFKMEAHDFSAWKKVNGTTHSRTCSKCTEISKGMAYSETAAHTWAWVVDTPATPAAAGVKHEECTGCNATRNVGTVIPALPNHAASGGGSYAPTTQKPEITVIGSGKAELSADGKTATITAAAGYELTSVVLNGKEMGKVEKLTGLKTGDKVTITFRAKAGEKDGKEETDKMIAREVSKLRLTARSARTAKKNVKLVVKSDLKAITDADYTVKYKFYRSTKKSAGYKAVLTKKAPTYVNTYGKKGTLYYYKVKVMVYDKDGNLIAQTVLKQCKYASRLWTK